METVSCKPTYTHIPTRKSLRFPLNCPLSDLSRRGELTCTSRSLSKGQGFQKQVHVYLDYSFDICSLLCNIFVLIYYKNNCPRSSLKIDAPGDHMRNARGFEVYMVPSILGKQMGEPPFCPLLHKSLSGSLLTGHLCAG